MSCVDLNVYSMVNSNLSGLHSNPFGDVDVRQVSDSRQGI